MYDKLSNRLKSQVDTVFSANPACAFIPKVILHNPETGYKFSPKYVDTLDINQDFIGNYMDAIQVKFPLEYVEYCAMQQNMQDLECTITLYSVSTKSGKTLLNVAPIIINARAILENQSDLSKLQNANLFNVDENHPSTPEQATMQIPYTLHLIEHSAYDLRHKQINCMTSNVTVEDMLHFVCYQFNIQKVKIIKPDNPQTYSNFVIPPVKGMGDVFSYIQDRYGVYSNGIGWYFTEDTIYIYPSTDTTLDKNTADGILRISNVPKDAYAGMEHYHCCVEDDIWIVSNTDKSMKSLNTIGEENMGGIRMSVNSDNIADGFSSMGTDGTVNLANDQTSIIQMANKNGSMSSTSQNIKFDGTRSNIYVSTSDMSMYNGSILATGWKCAIPRAIVPGQVVEYCYDDVDSTFTSQKGRVQRVTYMSSGLNIKVEGQHCFAFVAQMSIFIDPEKKQD